MFEAHGWITIRHTAENRDTPDEEERQADAIVKVWTYARALGYPEAAESASIEKIAERPRNRYSGKLVSSTKSNVVIGFGMLNGESQLWIAGFKNHATVLRQELLDLLQYTADVAPGSYGLLYTLDDEDPIHYNAFRVYVLARGTVTERADPFLSPFVPRVEDEYRND